MLRCAFTNSASTTIGFSLSGESVPIFSGAGAGVSACPAFVQAFCPPSSHETFASPA